MPTTNLQILNWGRLDYSLAWQQQKQLVEKRAAEEISDTLVFVEHPKVITLGRAAQRGDRPVITDLSIPVLEIERGGLATYHGPGQVVIYPIVKLDRRHAVPAFRGIHELIRSLEDLIISFLSERGVPAGRVDSKTGVWLECQRKIASIGIAVRHWVSYHGLAFNLNTGPEPWKSFNPCGFDCTVMTDLHRETGESIDFSQASAALERLALALYAPPGPPQSGVDLPQLHP